MQKKFCQHEWKELFGEKIHFCHIIAFWRNAHQNDENILKSGFKPISPEKMRKITGFCEKGRFLWEKFRELNPYFG